jgi:hypothetical protein
MEIEMEIYKKIITVNDQSQKVVMDNVDRLLFFMYEHSPNVEFFRINWKYSEKCPFAKDLLLEWSCPKQPERSKREDHESGCGALNTVETS